MAFSLFPLPFVLGFPVRLKVIGYVKLLHADFAKFVLAIVQIVTDIRSFCVILLLILLMFANVFYVMLAPAASGGHDDGDNGEADGGDDGDDDKPFRNVPETLLTLYRMMLGGASHYKTSSVLVCCVSRRAHRLDRTLTNSCSFVCVPALHPT